jgi:hypothetical protein
MFSDHLKKFDEIRYRTLLWVAAGLVLLCQLVAVAFVADEQVTKARIREFQRHTEMLAIAQCIENSAGAARQSCIQQARIMASSSVPPAIGSAPKALADASSEPGGMMASNGTSAAAGSVLPTQPVQGFMAASFAIR